MSRSWLLVGSSCLRLLLLAFCDSGCSITEKSPLPGDTPSTDTGCAVEDDTGLLRVWHEDADNDGHGSPDSTLEACRAPTGFIGSADDCDDSDPLIHPESDETPYDGSDNDCDPFTPDDDLDRDGFDHVADCDDANAAMFPGADEVCGDRVVNDCDSVRADVYDICGDSGTRLLGTSDAIFIGEDGDNAGDWVADGGDLNGDGLTDLLIAASESDLSGLDAGAVYVVFGQRSDEPGRWRFGARVLGESASDDAGQSISGAADVDLDGYGDFIVGALRSDAVEDDAGAAYLVLGPVTGDCSLTDAESRLTGAEAGELAGASVSAVNSDDDGHVDLLIGALYASWGSPNAGAVYIARTPVSEDVSLTSLPRLTGEVPGGCAGASVSDAGDVNGDGLHDLLVGASDCSHGSGSGSAYVLLGPVTSDHDLSDADLRLRGEAPGDGAGSSVDGVGDTTGDGYDDVIVGALRADSEAGVDWYTGSAYLATELTTGESELRAATAQFDGEEHGDLAGVAVAGSGDMDGDELADLLIGARGNDATDSDSGAAYVILSPTEGTMNLSTAHLRLIGEEEYDYAGQSVTGLGDANGDGSPDLLVGALGSDLGGDQSGAAYLVLGGGY